MSFLFKVLATIYNDNHGLREVKRILGQLQIWGPYSTPKAIEIYMNILLCVRVTISVVWIGFIGHFNTRLVTITVSLNYTLKISL
jgi:hypothetical protein